MTQISGINYAVTSTGRLHSGIFLADIHSYVQVTGLTRLGTSNWPFTIAIWIYPENVIGGTIMHLSPGIDGTGNSGFWCLSIMGFTLTGQIVINSWNGTILTLIGPLISRRSWTHVTLTYSFGNGLRLYINGTMTNQSSAPSTYMGNNVPMTITLGNSLNGTNGCPNTSLLLNQYHGILDELQIYARELNALEISRMIF